MIIDIPDSLSGQERRRLLRIEPIKYALDNFGTKKSASDFLGISPRSLRGILSQYKELKKYLVKEDFKSKLTEVEQLGYEDMMRRYPAK